MLTRAMHPPRRPALPLRLVLLSRCWLLRWNIDSTEQYMAAAERDGILDGVTLRHWRDQMAADRVRLALLEAQIAGRAESREPPTHAGPLVRSAREQRMQAINAGVWRGIFAGLAVWGAVAAVLMALGANT